jgi:hypothetical protein
VKRTWIRPIRDNDRSENVLRLTDAKSALPADAFVSGEADDPHAPPVGKRPIEIEWGTNGERTKHFIREDSNRFMITHRTDAVRKFYSAVVGDGRLIAITQIGSHVFLVTPIEK